MTDPLAEEWKALERELSSVTAPFWWRDDDAAEFTPALCDFLGFAKSHNLPVALAVIPGMLDSDTAKVIARDEQWTVIQHGYLHANHSALGEEKCELSDRYPLDRLSRDLARGREILLDVFGAKSAAVVAPPWNSIGTAVKHALPSMGFRAVSLFGARYAKCCAPGLAEFNTHVDLVDWSVDSYGGDARALRQIVAHLRAKRLGRSDPLEPAGILSHHGRLSDAARAFVVRLLTVTAAMRVRWADPRDLFAPYF